MRGQARRYFSGVHWAAGDAEQWRPDLPTLIVANHSNWWDGFLAAVVSRALGLSFHVLMDAVNLERYGVFRHVGALPIHRDSPHRAYADLHTAARALRPRASLWIFPQGRRRPPAERPAGCERGAAEIVLGAGGPLRVVAVGFRYAFVGEQLPEAFVLVGNEWVIERGTYGTRRALMPRIEQRLGDVLDELDARLAGEQLGEFRPLIPGKLSVNKRMDRFRHAVGLLDGPFELRNG